MFVQPYFLFPLSDNCVLYTKHWVTGTILKLYNLSDISSLYIYIYIYILHIYIYTTYEHIHIYTTYEYIYIYIYICSYIFIEM